MKTNYLSRLRNAAAQGAVRIEILGPVRKEDTPRRKAEVLAFALGRAVARLCFTYPQALFKLIVASHTFLEFQTRQILVSHRCLVTD